MEPDEPVTKNFTAGAERIEEAIRNAHELRTSWRGDGHFWTRDDLRCGVTLVVHHNPKLGYQSAVQDLSMGEQLRKDLGFTGPWRPEIELAQADAERLADYFVQFAAELVTKLRVPPRSAGGRARRGRSHGAQ